jgi:DNA-binding GntR family transcriptional regulator
MTPVREALDLLVSSGLAERVPYRGVRVLQLSNPDILDSYEARLVLESAATRLAAVRIQPPQILELRAILEDSGRWLSLDDMPRQRDLSRQLHGAIVEACGNPLLHQMYLTALKTFPDWRLYEHLYRQPELLHDSLRREHSEHTMIVDALAQPTPRRQAHGAKPPLSKRPRAGDLPGNSRAGAGGTRNTGS